MTQEQEVAMEVNLQTRVESLKYSFTNKMTVLSELMQNARRAGASAVRFNYTIDSATDSNTLVVSDDGCGIESMETVKIQIAKRMRLLDSTGRCRAGGIAVVNPGRLHPAPKFHSLLAKKLTALENLGAGGSRRSVGRVSASSSHRNFHLPGRLLGFYES